MGSVLRVTCAVVSAVTIKGIHYARSVAACPARQFHWSRAFFNNDQISQGKTEKVLLSDEEWRTRLTPEQYHVCRLKGTERPFTGEYNDNHRTGVYKCAGCGVPLFSSGAKFDSGSGWPSFYDVLKEGDNSDSNVVSKKDVSHGMVRVEVLCKKCDCHLGHVFDDGPRPTGQRYCINSASLDFQPQT